MSSDRKLVIEDDGNARLVAFERVKEQFLRDDPKLFPKLTAAHLMGGELVKADDTRVRNEIDAILPRDLRARVVGAALFKFLRDGNPILLYDVYLLQRQGFVNLLKETSRPDSMADGLTDAELERAWDIFELNMKMLAASGAHLRKRKDWRG